MKIYLTNYDLSKRADKTIYASQYSSFKAGIKVPGAENVKLFDGQTEISADASLFHGYKAFPLDAGDAGQKEYTVKADGSELKLKVVSTESTAAELNDKDTVFDLPVATAETLGGVKVGPGLSVGADGTLSASGGSIPDDLSVDTIYSAKSIKLANPDDGTGLDLSWDPANYSGAVHFEAVGDTQIMLNLKDFSYTGNPDRTEATVRIGDVTTGGGIELIDQGGSLTCQIACNGLTSDYVSTGSFYAPAIEAQDDGSGSEIATLGCEDFGLYVKYDGQNSTMVGCFSELTCGQDAEFRANVTADGYIEAKGGLRASSSSTDAYCELVEDMLTFVDANGGITARLQPIVVTIGGVQYQLLGYQIPT